MICLTYVKEMFFIYFKKYLSNSSQSILNCFFIQDYLALVQQNNRSYYLNLLYLQAVFLYFQTFQFQNNLILFKIILMIELLKTVLAQDQANLIFCMLISIPISYLLYLMKQKYLFLALSMSVTLAFQSFLFPVQKYFLWVQQQIVYLLILFAPRKYVGHIVIVQSFLALAFVQIRRIYISYGVNGVDITGIFMMQLFCWVGMAYNYQNGGQDQYTLSQDKKRRMIKERPSYITYLGYVNFLPACLIGPVYQYRDYQDYLNRVGDYVSIPSPLKSMAKQLGVFVAALVVYFLTLSFQIQHVLTEQFSNSNLFVKILFIIINIFNIQLKYVTAWSLGMISMKASGLTYNPSKNKLNPDGSIQEYNFNKVQVTDLYQFYIKPSIKEKAQGWNMSVQNALKKYIYGQIYDPMRTYRDEKQKKKYMTKAQYATLMTSALWHGFYLGYFITFFHYAICLQISAQFYKFRIRNEWFKKNWQKNIILPLIENIVWTVCINYFGMAIHLMIWSKIQIYLWETLALPYLILYVIFFLVFKMNILAAPRKKQQKSAQGQKSKQN